MPRILVRDFTVPADAIDVFGHVNNKEYLKWMEDIATEHSATQGWTLARYRELGASWYVRHHFVEYLRPAFEGMPLVAATWVETLERRASLRRYAFLRAADRKPVATAQTLWIFVDLASGRARDVPPQVRDAFPRVLPDDPELRAAVPIAIPGRPPAA